MNRQKISAMLRSGEGRINHLYRDSKGFVTIAEGHLVATIDDLAKLGFDPEELPALRLDWARVCKAPANLKASAYAAYTTCRMSDAEMDALTDKDIDGFVDSIRKSLPSIDTMPEPAQDAVFDIAYNAGVGGMMSFHHMISALRVGDYKSAAIFCHRKPPISDERNAATAALFMEAAKVA